MNQFWLIPIVLVAFVAVFGGIWSFVCWIISVLGGWSRLAKHYRAGHEPAGHLHARLSAMLGLASYRGTLALKVCQEGLYLKVSPFFKIAHPSLLIPWSDVAITASGGGFTTLKLGKPHPRTLRVFIAPQLLDPASIA